MRDKFPLVSEVLSLLFNATRREKTNLLLQKIVRFSSIVSHQDFETVTRIFLKVLFLHYNFQHIDGVSFFHYAYRCFDR